MDVMLTYDDDDDYGDALAPTLAMGAAPAILRFLEVRLDVSLGFLVLLLFVLGF